MWKLSIVLLSVMRVIMPLISSNPFDLVSEGESRQRWMYRHMLCVWSFGGAESSTCKISYVMVPLMRMTLVMLLQCNAVTAR